MELKAKSLSLDTIAEHVSLDPGLRARTSVEDINGGIAAARLMNEVILEAVAATGVNADGRISAGDMQKLSDYIRADDALYARFVEGHGDDEGNEETGFHLVQGDGGTLKFQGRAFINTVADAIYHVGFPIVDGRFENEDGDANELAVDVAGWLNYYLNGVNIVYGSAESETLYSGKYSAELVDAANELFYAGSGDDKIWAGEGDDSVRAGDGNDVSGGGKGDDTLRGQDGDDKLWGEQGDDSLIGGNGADELGGHTGDDTLRGGRGDDKLWGDAGEDSINGNGGNDKIGGGSGDDLLTGGSGDDEIGGGSGADRMLGGSGNDKLWGVTGEDTIKGGSGDDRIGAGQGHDLVRGGSGDDTIWGDQGNDRLKGGRDDDVLGGADGQDTLSGGSGDDTLTGGNGRDIMRGGTGRDELLDWEDGKARDIFVFRAGDSGLGDQADVIKGFDAGRGGGADRIDLSEYGGLRFIGTEAFSSGASVRVDKDLVQIDVDGDGGVDEEISVLWVGTLEEVNFIL
ncbi:calcium-binding protein [Primorskyibacter sp. S187A]|uniref:calcium-binding protein n=1 Tax=Primorskyibacter sp. S187A TaxID=3415130 RepID=UPI003C7C75E1